MGFVLFIDVDQHRSERLSRRGVVDKTHMISLVVNSPILAGYARPSLSLNETITSRRRNHDFP